MGQTSPPKKSADQNQPAQPQNLAQRSRSWVSACWQFSRPHTIFGTSLSVFGLYGIAVALLPTVNLGDRWLFLLGALVTCLSGNVYIVGLNQLEDIAIDQINKPHLPLASGELSRSQAQFIVILTGILALLLSFLQGPWLLATVGLSLIIGTAYSLPPVRLKRFPFWAALCIFTVRGVIVNLGLFLHFTWVLDSRSGLYLPEIPPAVWALTWFVLGFTFAIAVLKDIPDMEGDRQYQIRTLTLRLGPQAVFNLARWVLSVCYGGMAIAGVLQLPAVNPFLLTTTHLLALGLLWFWSLKVNLQDQRAMTAFYQFIWKLFFLEYLIFPLACLAVRYY
ncbi:MAG: homogentisate phytyltransferase [Leptolyngbyaceae bacterium]|nr:homogentisate phytyltransferase [Leptolyngbyaceae bacterium]